MSAPQRIRLSRRKGFDLQAASHALNGLPAVNAARPGPLGNPFVVGIDGDRAECVRLFDLLACGLLAITTKATVASQMALLLHVGERRRTLRGHNLACWCALDGPCHADILLDWINRPASYRTTPPDRDTRGAGTTAR